MVGVAVGVGVGVVVGVVVVVAVVVVVVVAVVVAVGVGVVVGVTDSLTAEYRRSRGWDADPRPTSRISCELPRDLVRRLNRQARLSGIGRGEIIRAAIEGMVRDFEQIDAEEGVACPVCQHHLSIHGEDGCQVATCDCIYREGGDCE